MRLISNNLSTISSWSFYSFTMARVMSVILLQLSASLWKIRHSAYWIQWCKKSMKFRVLKCFAHSAGLFVMENPIIRFCESKLTLLARLILSCKNTDAKGSYSRARKAKQKSNGGSLRIKARVLPDVDVQISGFEASYNCRVNVPEAFKQDSEQREPSIQCLQCLQKLEIAKVLTITDC